MKRILALLLCAAALTMTFAGCKAKDAETATDPETTSDTDTISQQEETGGDAYSQGIDFDAAFYAYQPDTVMINFGDYAVTWEELYFSLRGNINALLASVGTDYIDWAQVLYDDVTYADFVMMYSVDNALMYKAIEYEAKENGVSLGPDDTATIQADLEEMMASYGGEEAFLNLIREEDGCYSKEMLETIITIGYLANLTFKTLYGEIGEKLTDDDVAEQTADDGYLMVKHILRLKPEEGEDTALEEIEAIYKQLGEYDGDDFDAFFDELMNEHSEDVNGLASFPDGYLFQHGDMVDSFYEASVALEVGDISEIVSSEYGYHIVYRVPIDFDTIPLALMNANDYRTIRTYTAESLFANELSECMAGIDPEYSPEYESIDFTKLFVPQGY